MESVPCNLCDAHEHEVVRVVHEQRYDARPPFTLVRCAQCGLVYLNPRPSEQEMPAYYPREYQAAMRQVLQEIRQSRIGRIGLRMMRRARRPPQPEAGRALDIGCASGHYLAALRTLGWEVYGIEPDQEAARYAREHFDVPVRVGTAEHALSDHPGESFDLVTMWHVLEHLFNPSWVLAQAYRVLRSDGLLILEMPNLESLWASILGEFWFPLEVPRHLYHFTPSTLQAMLTKAGFRLERIASVPAPMEIIWSLQVLWNRWRHTSSDRQLVWSAIGVVPLYPVEWVLARLGRSTFIQAVAAKPP